MIYKSTASLCAVTIQPDKCRGCVHCMRKCPTEAIRVRDGKAYDIDVRCVGCGECVRSCPTRAKVAVSDPFAKINEYRYKVALPCPPCYGQFQNLKNGDFLVQGLLDIGFDDVEEVTAAAEVVSTATRQYLKQRSFSGPVISSACPAIVKLIQISYGHLVNRISPVKTPEEVAAERAIKRAEEKGYCREDVGIFVISPCSAKWEAFHGCDSIDGVIAFESVYFKLVDVMNKIIQPTVSSKPCKHGLNYAVSGGEADGAKDENYLNYLAADGVENCIKVIEEIDHDKLDHLDFVELNACPGGCVGGVFNIENPFLATTRLRAIRHSLPYTESPSCDYTACINTDHYTANNVFRLSEDRTEALQLMQMIECIHAALPGLDCGSCGAPSCRAMAEDVALYDKNIGRCPFMDKKGADK